MHLPQVDVVDIESSQGGVQGLEQMTTAGIEATFGARTLHGLGRQHDVVSAIELLQQVPNKSSLPPWA